MKMNRNLVYKETLLLYILVLTTFISAQSPPKFLEQPPAQKILIQDKKSLVLKCEAEGQPTPKYRWIKNGKNFDWYNNSTPITQQDGYGTLKFTKPTIKDEGQYQCFAYNYLGTATSNSVTVIKAELKTFIRKPVSIIEVQEGKPFQFFCDAPTGWPKPTISWVKEYQESGKRFSIIDDRMTVDSNGTLWISYLRKDDTSDGFTYTCKILYGLTIESGNDVVLNVFDSPAPQNKEPPIRQYVTRKSETVILGETVELFCIYGGFPLPQTSWLKNGSSIKTDERVQILNHGKSLHILYARIEDKGTYSCHVENGVGPTQSHNIELDVMVVPYFITSPEIVEKAVGETAVIECDARGNPNPTINWIHNGRPLGEAPPNPRRFVTSNSIKITSLTEKDNGNYGCNATNSIGYVYKDVYINVLTYAPTITEFSHNVETVDGNFVTLKCKNFGSPRPHVTWTKNNIELTNRRYLTQDNGNLQISEVNFTDAGYYTCTAYNSYGNTNATVKLNIKEHTRITFKPEDNVVIVGSMATFLCKATGDRSLNLTIDWLADGIPINFDSESRFNRSDDFSMTITKIIESDSKTYTCLAKTELDNVTASAKLIIQDKPNQPQLLDIKCNDRDVVIQWQPTGDNHSPILHYTIEYNTNFAPNTWSVALNDIPASNKTCTVPMTPWTDNTFRVIATNKIGKSIPSLHSRVCSSKPDVPYDNPENVEAVGSEPTNLVIRWTPMPKIKHNGPGLRYKVYWKQDKPDQVWNSEEIADYNQREFVVRNQPSYQRYKVKVVAFNKIGESRELQKKVIGYSGEGVPIDAPQNLTVLNITGSRSAILSWQPVSPESVKGVLKGYKIQFWTKINNEKNLNEENVSPNLTRTEIKHFLPNSTYYIHILAYNNHFNGPPSQFEQFNTLKEGDDENDEVLTTTASLAFYIGMLLFLLFVVILFISICIIKLYRRSKKFVFKPGDIKDFQRFSHEPQFNESFRPLCEANISESDKGPAKNDTISMKELDESDLEGMTEDGSFIGVYRQ